MGRNNINQPHVMSLLNAIFASSVNSGQYYFSRLTDSQKTTYKTIASGIEGFASDIKLSLSPMNETSMIFEHILLDNPSLFYVLPTFKCVSDLNTKKCVVLPDYKYTRSFAKQTRNTITQYLRVFDAIKSSSDIDCQRHVAAWSKLS